MVVLYSNHCPLCNRLKEVLDDAKVDYEEVNDIDAMIALGIDKTPMLKVDMIVDGEVQPVMLKYAAALKWVEEQRGTHGQD
jgi:predicted DCC family thiol-disulfide oxidoreductase YuxK